MGRYGGSSTDSANTNLTVSGSNIQILQAEAGSEQIAVNDLVVLKGVPARLYPVKRTDYAMVANAGLAAVASTTVSGVATGVLTRRRALVDTATGEIFYADCAGASNTITKFSAAGEYIKNKIVSASGVGSSDAQIMFLSDGNILYFWWESGGDSGKGIYFSIVDKQLKTVVAKTLVSSNVTTNPPSFANCTALSGGGFAISWGQAGGLYLTIRSNAGAVVLAETKVSGSPNTNSTGSFSKIVQLSNNNLFIAIAGFGLNAFAIYTPAGAVVVGYTEDGAYGYGAATYPEASVLAGYACMSAGNRITVVSNAGGVQGLDGAGATRIVNDGTYFWLFTSSGASLSVSRLAPAGLSVVTTAITLAATITGDVLQHEAGFTVFDGNAYVLAKESDGTLSVTEKYAGTAGGIQSIKLTDDCVLAVSDGKFQVTKYRNASIIGVAQTAVAAGNAGAMVQVASGILGSAINTLLGRTGKKFDHSTSVVVGAKGAIYNNAVTIQGVA